MSPGPGPGRLGGLAGGGADGADASFGVTAWFIAFFGYRMVPNGARGRCPDVGALVSAAPVVGVVVGRPRQRWQAT